MLSTITKCGFRLWHTEIVNALLIGERRRVVNEAQVIDYLTRLSQLPIVTDNAAVTSRRDLVMALAREHRLTAYDATYLDLALRTESVLATFDTALAKAMRRAGGAVFCDDSSVPADFLGEKERDQAPQDRDPLEGWQE